MNDTNNKITQDIINALNKWIAIGCREDYPPFFLKQRYRKIAPTEYQPENYLEFRKSICNFLWIDSIYLDLIAKGKDQLAQEIKQRRDGLINEIYRFDKNLESTDIQHLPNRQLIYLAAHLRNALATVFPAKTNKTENPQNNNNKLGRFKTEKIKKRRQLLRQLQQKHPNWGNDAVCICNNEESKELINYIKDNFNKTKRKDIMQTIRNDLKAI